MIPKDKEEHFLAGVLIVGILWAALGLILPLPTAIALASGLALLVCAAKELVWDLALENGDPSWSDFFAGALGVASVAIPITLAVLW